MRNKEKEGWIHPEDFKGWIVHVPADLKALNWLAREYPTIPRNFLLWSRFSKRDKNTVEIARSAEIHASSFPLLFSEFTHRWNPPYSIHSTNTFLPRFKRVIVSWVKNGRTVSEKWSERRYSVRCIFISMMSSSFSRLHFQNFSRNDSISYWKLFLVDYARAVF